MEAGCMPRRVLYLGGWDNGYGWLSSARDEPFPAVSNPLADKVLRAISGRSIEVDARCLDVWSSLPIGTVMVLAPLTSSIAALSAQSAAALRCASAASMASFSRAAALLAT